MASLDIKITLSTSRFQSWGMVASGADTFLMLTTLLSALNNLVCLGIISWAVDTLKGQVRAREKERESKRKRQREQMGGREIARGRKEEKEGECAGQKDVVEARERASDREKGIS